MISAEEKQTLAILERQDKYKNCSAQTHCLYE